MKWRLTPRPHWCGYFSWALSSTCKRHFTNRELIKNSVLKYKLKETVALIYSCAFKQWRHRLLGFVSWPCARNKEVNNNNKPLHCTTLAALRRRLPAPLTDVRVNWGDETDVKWSCYSAKGERGHHTCSALFSCAIWRVVDVPPPTGSTRWFELS